MVVLDSLEKACDVNITQFKMFSFSDKNIIYIHLPTIYNRTHTLDSVRNALDDLINACRNDDTYIGC